MILVTEDHVGTRRALVRLLKHYGFESVGVEDGAQALLFLRTHTPRLMILDYAMPGMTGLDVLRAMQAEPRLREIPVLMFSAYDSGPLRAEAMRLGACDYLVKGSLNWESLATHVRKHARAARVDPPPVDAAPRWL